MAAPLLALAVVLVVAAIVVGFAMRSVRRLRRTLDERVEAEAGRIAGEWASRSELAAALDPAALIERTLSELSALPRVDAAVMLVDDGGRHHANASGISAEEAERVALQTPANTNLRAIEVVYRYRLDDADGASAKPRAGIVVPLRADDRALGSLAVLSHSSATTFPDEVVDALEGIARRAGPALLAARQFAEARQLADLDSLTGLYNRRSFRESLAREVARARRYQRRLALIVLDLDNFKRVNDTIGHLAGDAAIAEVGRRMLDLVRTTDIACRFGGDEFAIILPESSRADAELLAERLVRSIAGTPLDRAGTLHASAGIAELMREDTDDDLFERADRSLYDAKAGSKTRIVAG